MDGLTGFPALCTELDERIHCIFHTQETFVKKKIYTGQLSQINGLEMCSTTACIISNVFVTENEKKSGLTHMVDNTVLEFHNTIEI